MSAFISAVTREGAVLLTDGAGRHGRILVEDTQKVSVGNLVAVTGRGTSSVLEHVKGWFIEWAAHLGSKTAIERLQDFADIVQEEMQLDGVDDHFEIKVVAYVPGVGGAHRFFQSTPMFYDGENIPPFGVIVPGDIGWRPLRIETDPLELLRRQPGETLYEWGRRAGLDFMQSMRERKIDSHEGDGSFYPIGGHVDLTLVTENGVTVETLRDWRDPLNEPIDPFRGMSRAERRRAERMVG